MAPLVITLGWIVTILPVGPGVTPNGSKDQEWRQQAGWGYSGIAVGGAAVANYVSILERLR